MVQGTLTIYSASAGSGKTYKLTGLYLINLFRSRYYYRKILAVTFTNKATAEMKARILDHLNRLATGAESGYLQDLMSATGRSEEWIREEAGEILNSVLHDFSRFSVSTIDHFFQKILRSFVREIGLHSGFTIELDHKVILSAAVDATMFSANDDPQLKEWLTRYALSNISEEKSWNLKEGIMTLAEELFRERYKVLAADGMAFPKDKRSLLNYITKVRVISSGFRKRLTGYGKICEELFNKFGLTDEMFYRRGQGIPRYVRSLSAGEIIEPNRYVREIRNDPPRWSTGPVSPELQAAISSGLDEVMREAIEYYDSNIVIYRSAEVIQSFIYALGILSDILYNVHLITSSENRFLLSDAGEVINLIIRSDQTPFIFEKTGNRYNNFMIDEFQDTSVIQWDNFRPLIDNSMAEGFDNMVVGDVKQSIYRWRNSDWQILASLMKKNIDNNRFINETLTTNRRSRSNIIRFNNSLFSILPGKTDELLQYDNVDLSISGLYSEAVQSDSGKEPGGYVRLAFPDSNQDNNWRDRVLDEIPGIIESLQDKGYNASDIGVIVRERKEGAMILEKLIDHNNNQKQEERERYNFNILSDDSLLLSNSPAIKFIMAVLTVMVDPQESLYRADMLRLFLMAKGDKRAETVSLISDSLNMTTRDYFPEGYEDFIERTRSLSLFEVVEKIIMFFDLGQDKRNIPYLNTFQDYVLAFMESKNPDISSFFEWWQTAGTAKSVVLPGNQDAIRILTIHKAKGLEFGVVILPFLNWKLDHLSSKQPVLWVRPEKAPFNDLGLVPVKYRKELAATLFAEDYEKERYSVYIDNLNLLYVAFTRARDAIYAFSGETKVRGKSVADLLMAAVTSHEKGEEGSCIILNDFYDDEKRIFEYGETDEKKGEHKERVRTIKPGYYVSSNIESLRLRLHGENYFSQEQIHLRERINYGKIMHELFENIYSPGDVKLAVQKLVGEGKITEALSEDIEKRIFELISAPRVAEWFKPGNEVRNETGILIPSGKIRRPDRVVIADGKTIVVDFKFGDEDPSYKDQIKLYAGLLGDMNYRNIEAYLWYVDKNKIIPV